MSRQDGEYNARRRGLSYLSIFVADRNEEINAVKECTVCESKGWKSEPRGSGPLLSGVLGFTGAAALASSDDKFSLAETKTSSTKPYVWMFVGFSSRTSSPHGSVHVMLIVPGTEPGWGAGSTMSPIQTFQDAPD